MHARDAAACKATTETNRGRFAIPSKLGPPSLLAMLFLIMPVRVAPNSPSPAPPVAPTYEIAFASFSPINAELFVADADGGNAKPFAPHAGFDGNASFSRDGKWIVFTSERDGSYRHLPRPSRRLRAHASR